MDVVSASLILERNAPAVALPAEKDDDRLMLEEPVPPRLPDTIGGSAAWLLTWRERGMVWPPADGELALSGAVPYTLVWNDQSLVWRPAGRAGELSVERVE